jgi:predicted small lipoprotein YifL
MRASLLKATLLRIVAAFAMLAGLSACGYKGPLTLPAPPPEASAQPAGWTNAAGVFPPAA